MHRLGGRRQFFGSSRRVGHGGGRSRRPMLLGGCFAIIMVVGLLILTAERSTGGSGGGDSTGLRKSELAEKARENSALAAVQERMETAEATLQHQVKILSRERDDAVARVAELEALLQEAESRGGVGAVVGAGGKVDAPPPLPPPLMTSESPRPRPVNDAGPYAECEDRFGLGLADHIAKSRVTVCSSEGVEEAKALPSSMECFPYQQKHKLNRGERAWDMFCVAHNFIIDFSKVEGIPATKVESHAWRQSAYHTFKTGSLSATCKPTPAYREVANKFMPHHQLQMQSFTPGVAAPAPNSYRVEETPTYLLARDEDCENLFHSMADHMNIYLVVEHVLKMRFQDLAVVLFDRHVDGPFYELIQTAFSPNHPIKRARDFNGEKVLFKKLIFHLESPAGVVFPSVGMGNEVQCFSSTYYHAFRKHVLKSFDLWDVQPPPMPTIAFSVRKRTAQKNVGRILVNEDAVVDVMKQGNMIKYQVVDLATMSFKEQLKVMRSSNIYIGVHGAGLMHAYFLAEEAIVMEIHPSYRLDRHFRIAARQSGKIYMPIRLTTEITCQGTSDNLRVDVDEFRTALDGAVRIARSFDRGVAECGLKCSPGILALDRHLDGHYGASVGIAQKGARINTQFPC